MRASSGTRSVSQRVKSTAQWWPPSTRQFSRSLIPDGGMSSSRPASSPRIAVHSNGTARPVRTTATAVGTPARTETGHGTNARSTTTAATKPATAAHNEAYGVVEPLGDRAV